MSLLPSYAGPGPKLAIPQSAAMAATSPRTARSCSAPKRSRNMQRSLRCVGLAAPAPISSRPDAQPPAVRLGLAQLDAWHDAAERALSDTVAAYARLDREVDAACWKYLRARRGVRIFRQRSASDEMPLLAVGTLRGRFDDVMEGLYSDNTEEMLLADALMCPRLAESAVLSVVQRQTPFEPYAFTGLKSAVLRLPGRPMVAERELCYFEKTGMVQQASGRRMGYRTLQSVNLAELPPSAARKRAGLSLCYLLEELDEGVVGVYMHGAMSQCRSRFATPAVTDFLLAVTNATECARAKKLAQMLAAVPALPLRRGSVRRCCDVCRGSSSFFENLVQCPGCDFKHVCRKCRMKEFVLARDKTTMHLQREDICRICIARMEETPMELLRAANTRANAGMPGSVSASMSDGGGRSMTTRRRCNLGEGLASMGDMGQRSEEKSVSESEAFPGSDRSLTAFTLKISVQLQDLGNRSDISISNLSAEDPTKMSLSEDEEENDYGEEERQGKRQEALLLDEADAAAAHEEDDVLNSISAPRKGGSGHLVAWDKDEFSRRSSRSTTSSASSYSRDEEDPEQYRTSLFQRLVRVSHQAEHTFHMTQEQSRIAQSVWERNRRATQGSDGSVYSQ